MNVSVSSQNWLSSRHNLVIKNCGPQATGMFSGATTTPIPLFRTINLPLGVEQNIASKGDSVSRREFIGALDMAAWDAQIERDDEAGKLDKLAEEALAAHRQGDVTDF